MDLDPSMFLEVWRLKRGPCTPGKHERPKLLERYLVGLGSVKRQGTLAQQGPEEVYRQAVALHPKCFAILYAGRMPEGMEIVL